MEVSESELERLYAQHGIPLRRLHPPLYRLRRWLGLKAKPPVLLTLTEHYIQEGLPVAVITLLGLITESYFGSTSPLAFLPLAFVALLMPVWNWWSQRRIRRRIGLEDPSA